MNPDVIFTHRAATKFNENSTEAHTHLGNALIAKGDAADLWEAEWAFQTSLFLDAGYEAAQAGLIKLGEYNPALPIVPQTAVTSLDLKRYPRDFKNIPLGTDYGQDGDVAWNQEQESDRVDYLAESICATLTRATEVKKNPTFTAALIAGDMVIIDAIMRCKLQDKISIVFVDTYHLFPETPLFMKEVEEHYGFKAKWYHAAGFDSQADFFEKKGLDFWSSGTIEEYDLLCKVEPLKRSLAESNNDLWINGRRRDMGALRAGLPIWEGNKLNPLAFWTFEDCWNYMKKFKVPYHPLHDVGYSSLGDMQSTRKVHWDNWMTYGMERSGRFQGLKNADGSKKTECGIHTEIKGKEGEMTDAEKEAETKKEKKARHVASVEATQQNPDIQIEIYTNPKCKYCNQVKLLCAQNGLKYQDYTMGLDADWGMMQRRAIDCCKDEISKVGKPEKLLVIVPQIFINGEWFGTYRKKEDIERLEVALKALKKN
jgi:phosphoadenosine phosphosulfate reductase